MRLWLWITLWVDHCSGSQGAITEEISTLINMKILPIKVLRTLAGEHGDEAGG